MYCDDGPDVQYQATGSVMHGAVNRSDSLWQLMSHSSPNKINNLPVMAYVLTINIVIFALFSNHMP